MNLLGYSLIFTGIFCLAFIYSSPPPDCEWGRKWPGSQNWTTNRSPCSAKQKLAFIRLHNGSYEGRCCSDRESMKKERTYAQQCNTTLCLVAPNDILAPCETLTPKYFIHGKPLRYEAGVHEDCKDPKTKRMGKAVVCCPRKSLDRIFLSSQSAEENEFPHMGFTGNCGCTVYNSEWLITSAHCVVNTTTGEIQNIKKVPLSVILGTNLNNINSTTHSFPVERVIVHSQFSLLKGHPERKKKVKRLYYDIALLKLKKKINFQKSDVFIRALPLVPEDFRPEDYGDEVIILGWGTTARGTGSQHLQKANLILRDKDVCFHKDRGKFKYASEFKRQFLCLGGIVNGSVSGSAGGGDSGGPAICRMSNGEAGLCGVSSFGADVDEDECGEQQTEELCFPSVYNDIGFFREWIEENAGKQNERELYRVKVYGDEDIPRGSYLHQVHITTEGGRRCGGTLITLDTVITAAHCVVNDNGTERRGIRIATGVRDLNRRVSEGNIYRPRKRNDVIRPRNFSRVTELDSLNSGNRILFRDSPYAYDIAVVKLDRNVEGIRRSDLPRLPENKRFQPGPAVEIAFPLESKSNRSGKMMMRRFDILDKKECKTRFNRFKLLGIDSRFDGNEVICGVERYSGGSTCDRELGGGLMCEEDLFCGVQTFRTCHMTIPNGFLSVAKYMDWIRNVM